MKTGRTKDGGYAIKRMGESTWTEVTEEVYNAAKAGPLASAGGDAMDWARDVAGNAMSILGRAGNPATAGLPENVREGAAEHLEQMPHAQLRRAGDELSTANDARQAIRRDSQPVASAIGRYGLEAATGGLGRGLKGAMAVDAALGALSDRENPVRGAVIGGAVGGGAYGATKGVAKTAGMIRGSAMADTIRAATGRPTRAAARQADDSIGAARNANPSFERQRRELEGLATPEEMKRAGFTLTPGEDAALRATSRREVAAANRRRDIEDVMTDASFGPSELKVGDLPVLSRWRKDDHKEAFTERYARELGEENVTSLTRTMRGQLMDENQAVLREYIDDNPTSIPSGSTIAAAEEARDAVQLSTTKEQMERVLKQIKSLEEDGVLHQEGLQTLSRDLHKRSQAAFNKGNHELGVSYATVQDSLNDALIRVVEKTRGPEAVAAIKKAKYNYGLLKNLEGRGVVSDDGIINPKSLQSAHGKKRRSYRSGKSNTELERLMDTVAYLSAHQTPKTGARTAMQLAGKGAGLAGAGAAAAAGFDLMSGD